nr:hypothetical protein Iba_chr03eCG3820 [Ipomoea batatas]
MLSVVDSTFSKMANSLARWEQSRVEIDTLIIHDTDTTVLTTTQVPHKPDDLSHGTIVTKEQSTKQIPINSDDLHHGTIVSKEQTTLHILQAFTTNISYITLHDCINNIGMHPDYSWESYGMVSHLGV